MTKTEALKALYAALGGVEETEDKQTITEMLNMISDIGEGEHSDDIAEAIANIAEVAESIQPSATLIEKTLTVPLPYYHDHRYASADDADGYSLVILDGPNNEEISAKWIEIKLYVDFMENTITYGSTEEELSEILRTKGAGERTLFYITVVQVI